MRRKALIISIKGTKLSRIEKYILSQRTPWGVILFKRNIKTYDQVKHLLSSIRKITKDRKFPIMIDEEGKTVSRLKNIINNNISANFFGSVYEIDKVFGTKILKHYLNSLTEILNDLGININTIPVLDVLRNNTNKVIGSRSFSKNPKITKELGSITIKHLHSKKILGVIKHVPGHGAATLDSHKSMPKVKLSLKKLNNIDLYPFKSSKAVLAMTAHILYTKLDKYNVATLSEKIIKNVIRKKLGFKGIIITDDISMKALKFDLVTNAKKSLKAGCNIVLYCAGKSNENLNLIKSVPYIDEFTRKKTSEIFKYLR
tara:strand:+ start:113 stop:1057 length:945 start_codon:yes stop_codon:yes gene_type:complete